AAEPQTGRREVSALTDARKTLAYDFFRILRAPHFELLLCHGTVCVVGKMRDLILQLSKSSIYSTKPIQSSICAFFKRKKGV
ncbi:hypothetical protein ACRWSV_24965, partial [Escherichia coli]